MPKAVLLTKHQKAQSIAPVLSQLGFTIEEFSEFDTDTLGTFSGETERTQTPRECALKKAQKACELTESDIGLGSEGSFGGGPMPGFMNWNSEILCFYQKPSETIIYAFAEGPTPVNNLEANSLAEFQAKSNKLPGQHWILRGDKDIRKGLNNNHIEELIQSGHLRLPFKLEPDLRAMYCPERQTMITKAAEDLAKRLISPCPQCQKVDFVVKDREKGLACGLCGLPTNDIKYHIKRCDHCGFEVKGASEKSAADPSNCGFCNP